MKLDKATILKKMLEAELLNRKQVSDAISHCKNQKEDIYDFLKSKFLKSPERINRFFTENFDFQLITLTDIVLNPEIINRVPTDLMVNHLIIPAFEIRQKVFLAVSDPLDIDGLNKVQQYTGETGGILIASKEHIIKALSEYIFKPKIVPILR